MGTATFETETDRETDLTIHTVIGDTTPELILAKMREYNAGDVSTKTLWDFRQAQAVARLPGGQIGSEASKLAGVVRNHPDRRTALVVVKNVDFGMLRMWTTYSEIAGMQLRVQVFYDYDKAIAWLHSTSE